jgi:hypothetical protein
VRKPRGLYIYAACGKLQRNALPAAAPASENK